MIGLTPRQNLILSFIADFRAERGVSPTFREIAARFGITKAGVACHLAALERKGYIAQPKYTRRGIEVLSTVDAAEAAE